MQHNKFQASLSQVVLKKIFEYFSMFFYGLNLRPLTRGHLGPWDLNLNKLGRGPLGNATCQFQTSGPSGSEEEDF